MQALVVVVVVETIEHLTDPVRFLHDLATRSGVEYLLMTVPYRRTSRFGGHLLRAPRDRMPATLTPEVVHIFEEELPAQWVGRMNNLLAWESFSDLFRYNRVQGPSLGVGYQLRPGPAFTTLNGRLNVGLSDRRVTGSVWWRRDAPGGRLEFEAFRKVREAEPWTRGLGFGNSMNAVFAGHDDADYLLALGGGVTFASYGRGLF